MVQRTSDRNITVLQYIFPENDLDIINSWRYINDMAVTNCINI